LGAFADLQAGLLTVDEILESRNIIKHYKNDFETNAEYDELDLARIRKIKQVLHLKVVKKMSAIDQAAKMFENTGNYFVIFNKSGNSGWHDFIGVKNQLGKIEAYKGEPDAYIGTASYVSKEYKKDENGAKLPRRTQENILDGVLLSQDLDIYKVNVSLEEALDMIARLIFEGKLEMPHFLIYSGRGMQLVWLTDNFLLKKGSGPERLFKAIQSYFMKVLKDLNPDKVTMTPSNVIRLAETLNSKNGAEVRTYLLRSDRLKLGYFKEKYLPIVAPNRKVKPPKKQANKQKNNSANNNKILRDTRLWNEYTLNYQRAHDVFRIVEYKQEHGEEVVGHRNHFAMVMAFHTLVYTSGDYNEADSEVERMWKLFEDKSGTSLEEIKRRGLDYAIRYYREWLGEIEWKGEGTYAQPGLFYKTITLVKEWNISKKCQIQLKTLKIRDKEYERLRDELKRRERGQVTREEYLEQFVDIKTKGIELKAQGLKYQEIAKELNVSVDTVKGWFRKKK
jgi:hypothetical protein